MSYLFTGNRQRARVSWSAIHSDNNREFEPHHDCVMMNLEKAFHTAIFPVCD